MLPRQIGLLGGSFNPAHGGHRRITLFAQQALELDEVWWLVSPGNPLKPKRGMAPLPARLQSAQLMARNAPIRATAIEQSLGTRYTVDTLKAIRRRYYKRDFIWLMGSDNLAQFHKWRRWRDIARMLPIAVIARPGYESEALTSPAMAWLRRYRVPLPAFIAHPGRAPAITILRFDPDPRSATSIRRKSPDWANHFANRSVRDTLTNREVLGE